MIRMMCEQMFSSLDRLVEDVLNEKKQEISPEDERDNELIRSAMRTRANGRSNAKLSNEEKDALERNGWRVNGKRFETDNGHILFDDSVRRPDEVVNHNKDSNFSPVSYAKKVFYGPNSYDYNYEWETSKVNLADMGRKHKTRKNSYRSAYPFAIKQEERGQKHNKGRVEDEYDARFITGNQLDAEREYVNRKIKENPYAEARRDVEFNKSRIKRYQKRIDYTYESSDTDREQYIKQINYYKNLLANLDSKTEDRVSEYRGYINAEKAKNDALLDKTRLKFSQRNNKNESLRRRKNGKRFI